MKWATWDEAAIASLISGLIAFGLGRRRPSRWSVAVIPAAREFAFIAGVYSIWRVARVLPLKHDAGAIERARTLNDWQQALHLPTELSLQHFVMEHDLLARFTTAYYAIVHVPSLIVFLIWLFVFHREHYLRWRTGLVILTAFCLVIRFIRVAPPRFLPELGFVDLSTRYGMSVYGPVGTGVSDQFAAMPSIHIGWAAVVSFGIVAASTSRWRWLALLHLALTFFVVAATGHHWWLDGFVALALLGIGLVMDAYGRRWADARSAARTAGAMIPQDQPVASDGAEIGDDNAVVHS